MSQVPIEELLRRCGSIYRLVLLSAKRAKDLTGGAAPLIDVSAKKVTTVALEEVLQGKVLYKPEAAAGETERKARGAKSAKKKRAQG